MAVVIPPGILSMKLWGFVALRKFNSFKDNFDDRYGGFKNSKNKFPKPHDYSFLMRYYNRTNNKTSLEIFFLFGLTLTTYRWYEE